MNLKIVVFAPTGNAVNDYSSRKSSCLAPTGSDSIAQAEGLGDAIPTHHASPNGARQVEVAPRWGLDYVVLPSPRPSAVAIESDPVGAKKIVHGVALQGKDTSHPSGGDLVSPSRLFPHLRGDVQRDGTIPMGVLRVRGRRHAVTLLFAFVLMNGVMNGAAAIGIASEDEPTTKVKPAQIREEQGTLPKYGELSVPDAEEMLRLRPFDWIVLKTQEVLVVEPLATRPDLLGRLPVKQEMAQLTYNRLLKHKPYRDAELASLKQYFKSTDRIEELNDIETLLKQELETSRERAEALKPATYKIQITLQDGSVDPEYVLELRHIDSIIYYEDLVLRRAEQLIEEGRTALAHDLLLLVARRQRDSNVPIQSELVSEEKGLMARVKSLEDERTELRKAREELNTPKNKTLPSARMRLTTVEKTIVAIATEIKDLEDDLRSLRYKLRFVRPRDFPNPDAPRKDDLLLPTWPRFDEVHQRLVFKDADQQLERGNPEESLRLLEDLWKPGSEIPGLGTHLGRATDRLIAPCMEQNDFRQARHFLAVLASRDPANTVVKTWQDELAGRAAAVIQDARAAATRGESPLAARTVDTAARIWPDAAGLKEAHRELTDRYQILRVGVMHLAGEPSVGRVSSEADERVRLLTEARLFEPAGISDHGVRYRSAFFESWEPTDLGRRVQFRLKLKRADWEARPLVTSADLYAELLSRTDRDSANYDERLAGFVDGITVQGPTEFSVNFRQLPLRPEALWQLTVAVGEATRSLNDDAIGVDSPAFGRERFQPTVSASGQTSYRRVRTQPAATRQRRVDEVTEIRYDSWDRALQGLLRGEVSVIPVAGLQDLKSLQDDGRFFVVPYILPRSHFLLFNPQNFALRDGQLRRALMHGIPRERLLKDVSSSHGRLNTCPISSNSYGYNRLLPQPDFDPALAAALALTAKKHLGGELPGLRMICPNDPSLRETAQAMIAEWKRVGIEVRLLDDTDLDGDWDICYRTAKCVEPLTEIWPLLTMHPSARVDALQSLSEPTRRMLLELERTVDWTTATKLLHRLLADLLIEARYIPLWEVDEYLVARKHVTGIPTRLMQTYDDIERWTVQSWYPLEAP